VPVDIRAKGAELSTLIKFKADYLEGQNGTTELIAVL
jgi:hypothetical protein